MEDTTINTNTSGDNAEAKTNSCDNKKCRCCLSFILNIVSLLAIGILFYLYFSNDRTSRKSTGGAMNIGFINSDSVMANYDLVKDMKVILAEKQEKAESSFAAQSKSFEYQVVEYQKKLKANTLSITEAQTTEKNLAALQEKLLTLKEQLTSELTTEEVTMNIALMDSITNYLKRYNKSQNYDYILGYSKGGGILYANDSLDLTEEIVKALNKEYKSTK